jgi:hypothetical protein
MPTPQEEMLADAQLFCNNVYGFAQQQPNCLGWTSLWLRCRLKDKEFWKSKFVPADKPTEVDMGADFLDIPVAHWEATQGSSNKSLQLQQSFTKALLKEDPQREKPVPQGPRLTHADYAGRLPQDRLGPALHALAGIGRRSAVLRLDRRPPQAHRRQVLFTATPSSLDHECQAGGDARQASGAADAGVRGGQTADLKSLENLLLAADTTNACTEPYSSSAGHGG